MVIILPMRKTDFEKSTKVKQSAPRANRDLGHAYVYLITCGEYTKIGVAVDPENRLQFMQIGNPHELKLVKVWYSECPQTDEECLHAEFESCRVRGEWFIIPQGGLEALMTLETLAAYRE